MGGYPGSPRVRGNLDEPNSIVVSDSQADYKLVPIVWFYLLILFVVVSALCGSYYIFQHFNEVKKVLGGFML
jgi:hypothetical protein